MSLALAPSPTESLTALDRLETLCDPDSLQVIRSELLSPFMAGKARAGDGVVAGAGLIDGRPVYCYAQDSSYAGGSLGAAHADTRTEDTSGAMGQSRPRLSQFPGSVSPR